MPVVTTGMTEEQAAQVHRNERPLLVYIYPEPAPGKTEDPRIAVEEDRAFQDESVVVGARFFDCVRIHKDDAREDRALKGFAGSAPCLVLVRPDFTTERSLKGRFNAGRIFNAMHDTLEMDYETCLREILKEQGKLADALAKIYQRQAELAGLDRKIEGEKDAAKRKGIQGKRDALAEEIRAAEDALQTQERSLYELKPKPGA